MIVAILVFVLAMGVVFGLIVVIYQTHSYEWEQAVAIDEARRGIETMIKEIREARAGDDGSYPIVLTGDKEFIFYSDIDKDGTTERVRYFLGASNSATLIQECQTSLKGGFCSVSFTNFLKGTLISAQVKVSVEGDFGQSREYAEIFVDGLKVGEICRSGCTDCSSSWQGTTIFDVTNYASDNSLTIRAQASPNVDPYCPHSMKAKIEFSFTEDISHLSHEFKKGVIKPSGDPPQYLPENEVTTILTSYVRNAPPIFEYFDQNGNKIVDYPARLKDTKLMKVYLVINVDPNRPPQDFELESYVQLRNLKAE